MKKLFTAIVLFLVLLPPAWGADGDPFLQGKAETEEGVEDIVGGMVTGNTETGITVTYQDADGTLDFEVTSASDTAAGIVELATEAEARAGTSSSLAVTPQGLGRGLVYNVVSYGADTADNANDDRSAIQLAINAADSAGGGIIYFPAGTYNVADHDADGNVFEVDESMTFVGVSAAVTIIESSDLDTATFYINTTKAVHFENLHITTTDRDDSTNDITDADSVGVLIDSNTTDPNTHTSFEGVRVSYHYTGIYFREAKTWAITRSFIYRNDKGVYIDNAADPSDNSMDGGDWTISDSEFSGNDNHVYQVAAGGGKIVNNKFIIADSIGIYVNIGADSYADPTDEAVRTSILLIANNSIEDGDDYDIYITAGDGYGGTKDYFGKITIVGNEIGQVTGSGLNTGVYIGHLSTATEIRGVTISANTFYASRVKLGYCDNVNISGNFFDAVELDTGTATSDPPDDTTGYFYDTAANFTDDQYNGTYLVMTSGTANGNKYLITDTVAATDKLVCNGENLYDDGVRSGDSYRIALTTIESAGVATNIQIHGNNIYSAASDVIAGSVDSIFRIDGGDNATDSSELRLYLNGILQARMFAYGSGDQYIEHEGKLLFRHYNEGSPTATLELQPDGDLIAQGDITATGGDFIGTNCCADYVFEPDYPLMSLDEMSAHIKQNNSLPNITQADQVRLGKMSQLLLEKTEEQAIYILELHERLKILEARLAEKTP